MKTFIFKWIGYIVLTIIYKTNKFEILGLSYLEKAQKQKRPIMLCVWHGRMLFPIFYVINKKLSPWAIASPYQDGAIVASILKKWNVKIIKGSSNKKPKNVINKMENIFKNDNNAIVCITNDGPKGPIHIAKKGSLELAQKFNAQIITVTGNATKKWLFNSWDKFHLPKPFSKIIIHIAPAYKQDLDCSLEDGVSNYMVEHERKVSEQL